MLRSLNKAFLLLDAFTPERPEWTLADLSNQIGIPKPTAHHILATLIEGGWVARHAETKKLRLGIRLWEKGWLAIKQFGVREVARPHIESLVRECGETVRLSILDVVDPGWVIYVDRVEGHQAVRAGMGGVVRAPSYCVASGKAMLAHNPDLLNRLIVKPLHSYTPRTLTSVAALIRDLAQARRRGYSLNQSEFRAEVVGIGAPIRNHEGSVVAAIGISGPAYRLRSEVVKRIAPVVVATASEISKRLGFLDDGGKNETRTPTVTNCNAVPGGIKRGGPGLPVASNRGNRRLRPRGRK